MTKKIFLISGGEYGDLYAAALASSIAKIRPEAAVRSFGAEGRANGVLEEELKGEKPDCIVLVDQSAFDFPLMEKAKKSGIPVIDYAGSHDRTSKARHLKKLKGVVDKALAAYPFERDAYRDAGVEVEFVGHPLVDIVDCSMTREEVKAALGYDRTEEVVPLLPGLGSAEEIIDRLRVMVEGAAEAAAWSTRKVRLVIPDAERYDEGFLNGLIEAAPRKPKAVKGNRQTALRASDAAVVAVGTETIEAALCGAHMLIIRKTLGLSRFFSNFAPAEMLYGLPNIILDKPFFPELVQKDVTVKNITVEVGGLLETDTSEETEKGLAEVRRALGEPGTIKRAAEAVLRVMG